MRYYNSFYIKVQSWSRKAQQCNMQLIPIPNDPFALSSKSDPLRGPIFIPLNFECLEGNRSYLFEGRERPFSTQVTSESNRVFQYCYFFLYYSRLSRGYLEHQIILAFRLNSTTIRVHSNGGVGY